MNQLKKVIYITIMLLITCTVSVNAKNYKWNNISQQQYIDNLVSCQIDLQEFKWSKNIWPKDNKEPKPAFSTILNVNQVRQQVLDDLKIQSILLNRFKISITDDILQQDLNRMATNSKDRMGLKQLFALFNNDANTIAQCIARPYLVKGKAQSHYNFDNEIHSQLRAQAQTELQGYLKDSHIEGFRAQVSNVTFVIKQEKAFSQQLTEEITVGLSKQEFTNKVQQLQNNSLGGNRVQEKEYGFIYTEITEQTQDTLTIKTLNWQKPSFDLWIQGQSADSYLHDPQSKPLNLPVIMGSNNLAKVNAGNLTRAWEPTSTSVGVPTSRSDHTAIWTGSEMIIWGGSITNSGLYFNTGGRYNPSTDSWQPTNTGLNVPSSRDEHTAIWTGSQMVIWGASFINQTNSGGRYNPITDSWQSTSTGANVPSSRYGSTAIWSGSEMIIWGGRTGLNDYLKTGGRYNPTTDSWQSTSLGEFVPHSRGSHTAIWTGDEMIIWGGFSRNIINKVDYNSGGRYDPVSDSWLSTSTGSNIPDKRFSHSATWTGNEMIIWGGSSRFTSRFNTGGRYDPATDSWLPTSTDHIARVSYSAIWSGSEMIVWSGSTGISGLPNTGGRYHPSTNSWQPTSLGVNVPSGRRFHTAIWTGNEMIIWGGLNSDGNDAFNTGGRYDPTIPDFATYGSNPTDGSELIFGPVTTGSTNPTVSIDISNNGDPETTLTGSCSINGPDAFKFLLTSDASFSLLPGVTDTETVACNASSTGAFNASLDCNHDGGKGLTASYPLLCTVTESVDFISDGTAIFAYRGFNSVFGGVAANFSATDDHLYAMWYWFRVSGGGAETVLPPPDSQSYVNDTVTLGWGDVDNNGLFDAQLIQVINQPSTGTATLVSTLKLTNISGGDVGIDLFNYFDFDVNLSTGSDEATLTQDPGFITISENATTIEQRAGGNDSYQVTEFREIADFLADSSIDNLDNSGLPFGPEDFTGAFQWAGVTIPVGGSYTIQTTSSIDTTAPVPNLPVVATNNAPSTTTDNYTLNEDGTLTADDADGSVGDANDNGVLANDTDVESDPLSVLNPGTFAASGIGGSITMAADGTFVYTPPADVSGAAGLVFDVTDGLNTVSSSLSINVLPVNDAPTTATDSYTLNEDGTLTADDGVLANDTDVDLDPLSVLNPGTFTASGIGGSITMAADGTFVYTPPADISGTAGLLFDVTDGISTVSSSLSIDVLPVNDAPSFAVLGDIDATNLVGVGNTQILIINFAHSQVFGPTDESDQNVQQFDLVVDDSDSILSNINLSNSGILSVDFSLNYGFALIEVTLQDDGGMANGGIDTSAVVEFVIAHFDLVFANGFESGSGLRLFDHLASITQSYPLNNLPSYDFNNDRLEFYGHLLQLDNNYASARVMLLVQYWLQAVLIKEDPFGDYDLDGIINIDDDKPLVF